MLLANRLVAEALGESVENHQLQAGLYRIHATPDYGKLAALQSFARNHDVEISINSIEEFAASVNTQLAKPATRANKVIATMVMRSMAKAEYSPDNIGHYGLAFKNYTHFTSPIRRYPDILVHRLLKQVLFGSTYSYSHEQLKKLGKYTTDQEKRAVMAERQSVKYNQIEYLETVINESFLGTIVSMEEYGFFVEIDKVYVEGLVHVSTLPKGYYVYDSVSQSLADVHSSSSFTLGQEVEVSVKAIDKAKRKIDFVLTGSEDNDEE
jgi:ribonuclease R